MGPNYGWLLVGELASGWGRIFRAGALWTFSRTQELPWTCPRMDGDGCVCENQALAFSKWGVGRGKETCGSSQVAPARSCPLLSP